MNTAKTDLRGLRLDFLILGKATSRIEMANNTVLARPAIEDDTYIWYLDSSLSSAYVHVAQCKGGAFDILKAGDITLLANKTLKIGNISGTGLVSTQQKYFPIDDGGVTRYIALFNVMT